MYRNVSVGPEERRRSESPETVEARKYFVEDDGESRPCLDVVIIVLTPSQMTSIE